MRILIVQESDWLKRNTAQQHHLAELMSLRGHKVRVIDYEVLHDCKGLYTKRQVYHNVSKIYDGAKVTVIRPGIIKIPILDYLSLLWTHYREIKRQIKKFKPDIIVGFGILNAYMASRLRGKIPFIYYWIDVLHELIPFAYLIGIGKAIEMATIKYSDRVLAINKHLRDYVVRLGASPDTDVLCAGVDFKRFNDKVDGVAIREQHNIKTDDTVLFFMGWLYHFSGLAEVISQMTKMKVNVKLLVVGDGDAYDNIKSMLPKLGMQDNVILVGKKPYKEIPSYISASDICILPAYPDHVIMRDIVPIKLYEYMAMGKAVIATSIPSVVEEFGIGNGIVFVDKPEDTVELALQLVSDNKLKDIGEKAKNTVSGYSWDKITDDFIKILQDTTNESIISN